MTTADDGREARTIRINGAPRPLEVERLDELLRSLGYDASTRGVAVALNEEVVPRSAWAERRLSEGDRVEIVGAVQGG